MILRILKKVNEFFVVLFCCFLFVACGAISDKNSAIKNSAIQNTNSHYYNPQPQYQQYSAPTYYQVPQPYYYQPQNYQPMPYQNGILPNSRAYSNPYDNPPNQYPYYDSDQYYVAPNSYNGVEDVQPKKSAILNSLNY